MLYMFFSQATSHSAPPSFPKTTRTTKLLKSLWELKQRPNRICPTMRHDGFPRYVHQGAAASISDWDLWIRNQIKKSRNPVAIPLKHCPTTLGKAGSPVVSTMAHSTNLSGKKQQAMLLALKTVLSPTTEIKSLGTGQAGKNWAWTVLQDMFVTIIQAVWEAKNFPGLNLLSFQQLCLFQVKSWSFLLCQVTDQLVAQQWHMLS